MQRLLFARSPWAKLSLRCLTFKTMTRVSKQHKNQAWVFQYLFVHYTHERIDLTAYISGMFCFYNVILETRYSDKGAYAGGLQGKYVIFSQEGILVLNLKGHCHPSFAVLSLKNETRYLIQEKISILLKTLASSLQVSTLFHPWHSELKMTNIEFIVETTFLEKNLASVLLSIDFTHSTGVSLN